LFPSDEAASSRLPRCPEKICVEMDSTLLSTYTTTAGAAIGASSRSSIMAALDARRAHGASRSARMPSSCPLSSWDDDDDVPPSPSPPTAIYLLLM
jgi:hypothetical protein